MQYPTKPFKAHWLSVGKRVFQFISDFPKKYTWPKWGGVTEQVCDVTQLLKGSVKPLGLMFSGALSETLTPLGGCGLAAAAAAARVPGPALIPQH